MAADESVFMPVPEKKWRLGFWSLIATQFQGAFNENALKFLVIYLILAVEKNKAQRDQMELLVGVLFAAPFILFSPKRSMDAKFTQGRCCSGLRLSVWRGALASAACRLPTPQRDFISRR